MPSDMGLIANTHLQITQMGIAHFNQLFKDHPGATLVDVICIGGHFPRFVEPDSLEDLNKPVTLGELESTLKWFKKDKSLGSNVQS